MTVAEWIVEFLRSHEVRNIYELSGGMITPMLDAAHGKINLIDMRHEQAAGFAAEAEARITGIPGVAMATSGPGAVNLLTAVGSCYFDSTPCLFITGQVPTSDLYGPRTVRQRGFQETDIVRMARPITKVAWQLTTAMDVIHRLPRAWELALHGRPGPVLLDIPFDVQQREVGFVSVPPPFPGMKSDVDPTTIDRVKAELAKAQRPIAIVGGGCTSPRVRDRVRSALDRLGIPVVSSLMGLDVTDASFGMIGTYGNRWANKALMESDLVLVLGSRLDTRQTGPLDRWKGKNIIHVDVDAAELGARVPGIIIRADVGDFCDALGMIEKIDRFVWISRIREWSIMWDDVAELQCGGINPNQFMCDLAVKSINKAACITIDVGAHQMWAAQSLVTHPAQRVLTSGGMGAMGWALPAAVGASLARNRAPVMCICGDAGFQVNMQELQTIRELNLPIKIIVMDNSGHGMVRQFQREVFGGRHAGTCPSSPGFSRIASEYEIHSNCIAEPSHVVRAINEMWGVQGPSLLHVIIDPYTGIAPKARFGCGLDEMDPPR